MSRPPRDQRGSHAPDDTPSSPAPRTPMAPRARPGPVGSVSAAVAMAAVAAWAVWPISPGIFEPPATTLTPTSTPTPTLTPTQPPASPPISFAGFERPVFTTAAAPPSPEIPAAPPPPAPPPPLRLQLLAIEHAGDALRAVLFDPEANAVVSLKSGDRIAGRTVARVAPQGVVFTLGDVEQTLLLCADSPIDAHRGSTRR